MILQQCRHDAVDAVVETTVLHDQSASFAHQVCPGANSNSLFFPTERNMYDFPFLLDQLKKPVEIDIRQRRDKVDARLLKPFENSSWSVC
jgi:hypothetical protein